MNLFAIRILLFVSLPLMFNGKALNEANTFNAVNGFTINISGQPEENPGKFLTTEANHKTEKKFFKKKNKPRATEAYEPNLADLVPETHSYHPYTIAVPPGTIFLRTRYLDGDRAPPKI